MIIEKKGEFVKEHKILYVFGPVIYQSTLSEEELKFVQDYAERSRTSTRNGWGLAGNIKEQRGSQINHPEMQQKLVDVLKPHMKQWYKNKDDITRSFYGTDHHTNLRKPMDDILQQKSVDYDSLIFDLANGPWFNYMKAGEFNPLHDHEGEVSGILMVKVPEEISTEHERILIDTNTRCPGALEWVHDPSYAKYRKYPIEGEIYMFPSTLNHQVYPFASDIERITMSWNIKFAKLKNVPAWARNEEEQNKRLADLLVQQQ